MPDNTAALLTPPHNYAVVQLPGRAFPGVVFQGDSLAIITERAADLARLVSGTPAETEARELAADFESVLRSYLAVLNAHSIEAPFTFRPPDSPGA